MNASSAVVLGVIIIAILLAARPAMKHFAGNGGCCGGGSSSGGKTRVRQAHVGDKDPDHYPYQTKLLIRGMTCEHCVSNVENALDSVDGVWATVDLKSREALVRSKRPVETADLERAVERAGYGVIRG